MVIITVYRSGDLFRGHLQIKGTTGTLDRKSHGNGGKATFTIDTAKQTTQFKGHFQLGYKAPCADCAKQLDQTAARLRRYQTGHSF
ncbi:hypothetical protein [Lacticaseibacillus yichunensis]|uniref:hypothetical protein n=1 Tax=Lacticaseibacillus yichunensis TaxID=2486015 RepID=UPI000F7B55E8|nr:hypothetical protein [Lacticaseibacillus yichunensis]